MTLYGQSAVDRVKSLAAEKEYVQAAKLIDEALKEKWDDVNFILLCGDIYFELSQYEKALELYRRADDKDSNEPPILKKLGTTLSVLGKHKEAFEVLKEAIEEEPEDAKLKLALADAYIAADSLRLAEVEITRARELEKSPEAYVGLGDLYFAQRVYQLASENYEEALSMDENLIEARIKLATSYYWLANREIDEDLANELFARSLKEWNKVTQQDPKNAKAYYQQGKILFFSGKFPLASQAFYEYAKLRPEGWLGQWYLGQSLYEIGKCDSAAPFLENVAQNIDSVKTKARLYLARCYFDNSQYNQAIRVYQKLSETEKLNEKDMKRFAGSAFNSGDTAMALDLYTQTVDMYPTETCELMYKLGRMFIGLKEYDRSAYVLNKRLATAECEKEKANTYYFLGLAKLFAERPDSLKDMKLDSARAAFQKAVELDSTNLSAMVYLADVYSALDQLDEGERLFREAIDRGVKDTAQYSSNVMQAFQKLCGIKLDLKKFNQLVKAGNEWAGWFPDSPYPYLYIAVGYQGQGNVANACTYYRKVLSRDPKNKIARKNLAALKCNEQNNK